jgi:hypothetical protein
LDIAEAGVLQPFGVVGNLINVTLDFDHDLGVTVFGQVAHLGLVNQDHSFFLGGVVNGHEVVFDLVVHTDLTVDIILGDDTLGRRSIALECRSRGVVLRFKTILVNSKSIGALR